MATPRSTILACALLASAAGSAHATDYHLALNWNWNGMLHPGEGANPDDPDGYRSISDRGIVVDGGANSLGTLPIVGATGMTYEVVNSAIARDIVHLGNTGAGTSRTWDAAAGGTVNRGVLPGWLAGASDHLQPQVTSFTGQNLVLDANSSLGVLYHVSNGGGTFQMVLTFDDASSAVVTCGANDWFGPTNPPAPTAGIASQTRLGGTTYTGAGNIDLPTIQVWPTQALAVTEAVITVQSLAQAGQGNHAGKRLDSITFRNPNQTTRGYAIFASTLVSGLGPPINDTCANAMDLSAGTITATSVRATGSTTSPCGQDDTADVWYRYAATQTGPVEVRTCGSTLDTTAAVYSACGGLLLGCNDDACGTASSVRWNAVTGSTYFIRIAANAGGTGQFSLTLDPAPQTHSDVSVPLAYNWNGMVHAGEEAQPDAPTGFRSISDRALDARGAAGALNAGVTVGTDLIPYAIVAEAGALDMVHLGLTGPGSPRQWDALANGDDRGTQPTWLPAIDQSGPQRSPLSGLNLAMGPETRIGVLFHASNNGGTVDCTLEFADGSTVPLLLSAPDWYQDQLPPGPSVGVEVQRQLGVFAAASNQDQGAFGAPGLNVVEAVFGTQSILAAGFGDVAGRRLTGLTFSNPSFGTTRGYAVFAATVRDAVPDSSPVPPTGTGSASPNPVEVGRAVLLSVLVSPGQNPVSTVLSVEADLGALGGAMQPFYDDATHGDAVAGDLRFSYSMPVSAGQPAGDVQVPFTVSDAQSRSTQGAFTLTITPRAWNEVADGGGDAGDLAATAQVVSGAGPLATIAGDLGTDDIDLYLIDVCDVGTFSATSTGGTTLDTQMFLFRTDGMGLAFNDDNPAGGLQSIVTGLFVPAPGQYLLGVGRYDRDPQDEGGQDLWLDTPFNVERAPDGLGAASPVAGWIGATVALGSYRLTLTGACYTSVLPPCDPDVTQDGNADQDDVAYLTNVVGGGENPTGIDPDFNRDGNADQDDIAALINVVAGGPCP